MSSGVALSPLGRAYGQHKAAIIQSVLHCQTQVGTLLHIGEQDGPACTWSSLDRAIGAFEASTRAFSNLQDGLLTQRMPTGKEHRRVVAATLRRTQPCVKTCTAYSFTIGTDDEFDRVAIHNKLESQRR